ncbi:response regulator transcription factor [Bombilactobacillus folatiphilus]|uniref:Response regulator transcription factor n=1 Tax=Bombilactobacillus folatiphilus TaxID=2923362 RepID=A0ABY4P7C4_9LACO|nr:response regulator transcription factor [Bombilactobacillus folatiphilus]UQS81451.1 response regulator transcription factor [Bombilactobacillus folatiphilus]
MTTVFLVDDDQTLIQEVRKSFLKWNIQLQIPNDWQHIQQDFEQSHADLIIMDVNLPNFDGFYWAQKIRAISKIPLIFLTAVDQEPSILRALSNGADDFLTKPFNLSMLVAKVRAILRRTQTYDMQQQTNQLIFGPYVFYVLGNEVVFHQQHVSLSPMEGNILRQLILNVDQLISTERFLQTFWQGGLFLDAATLRVNMSRLRHKLQPIGLQKYIVTQPGAGYRLIPYEK